MATRILLAFLTLLTPFATIPSWACCAIGPRGKPVVNADQTVIIVWDAARQTQHFIRQATFRSDATDFGFLIPSPSEPQIEEAGDAAFEDLKQFTAPEKKTERVNASLGCGSRETTKFVTVSSKVNVLQSKVVAGLQTVVLETTSPKALVAWLQANGYPYTSEVEGWVTPYLGAGWKITAFKVATGADAKKAEMKALRLSFKTDRPLFPYREPDNRFDPERLGMKNRLLRIFFLAEAKYQGQFSTGASWKAPVVWSGPLNAGQRTKLVSNLKLSEEIKADTMWLTEFEHDWPYRVAPGDVIFSTDPDQSTVARPPIITYVEDDTNLKIIGLGLVVVMLALCYVVVRRLIWFRRSLSKP
ncbi:hypothetical protein BH11PLA2_BH11PLA2_07500 [soil metagenome]